MMNDGFSVQLRRHLVGTADERPADGQLAAVVERLAVTAQRRPLVARLTWFPGRIGPFPTRALRYGLLAAALLALTVAAAILVAGALQRPSTIFEGTWTSIDPADRSTQTLAVGSGNTPPVHFQDHFASGAACVADTIKLFEADGTGAIDGDRLAVTWPDGGGCGSRTVDMGPGTYTYDKGTDTIVDGQQLTWTRVRGGGPIATGGPSRQPTAIPTTLRRDPACVDLSNGGVYSVRLGSVTVTLDVPVGPLTPWEGRRDAFDLTGSCQTNRPIDIQATIVTTIHADACDPEGSSVAVSSQAEAIEQFAAQVGHDTDGPFGPGELNGYPATRFAVSASAACDSFELWNGVGADDHGVGLVYFVDADGVPLGILVRFRDDPGLTGGQRDEALTMLSSLHVDSRLAVEATDPPAVPTCIQFDSEGTYTANVGTLPMSLTVPGTPAEPWSGMRDEFALRKATCDGPGLPLFRATIVDQVYADACHWKSSSIDVPTTFDAVQELMRQTGHDTVGPTETQLGPYRATRFDFSVPQAFDSGACDGEIPYVHVFGDQIIPTGGTLRVYVTEVDGVTLVVSVNYFADELSSTDLAQIDAILGSMRIEP